MNDSKAKNIIALSLISGIGAAFIKKHLPFLRANANNIEEFCALNDKISKSDLESNLLVADEIIRECKDLNIHFTSIIDDNYPQLLLEIKDPPPVLYYKGNISLISKAVGIIGTRKSSDLGNKIANKVGLYFSKDWAICNGLVDGIDKYSVFVDNKILPNVIGVLSGGLNFETTSSKLTKELAQLVLENNGLLISEYEPNKKEDQFSGSKASRIQAGLSNVLILVQSSKSGGSKYTIKAFSELNRPLAVIDFKNNNEFANDDIFAANRLIIENGKKGILEMCDIKKIENISISKIIGVAKSEDYQLIEKEITAGNKGSYAMRVSGGIQGLFS